MHYSSCNVRCLKARTKEVLIYESWLGTKCSKCLYSVATKIYICMLKVSLAFLHKPRPERCPESYQRTKLCVQTHT